MTHPARWNRQLADWGVADVNMVPYIEAVRADVARRCATRIAVAHVPRPPYTGPVSEIDPDSGMRWGVAEREMDLDRQMETGR